MQLSLIMDETWSKNRRTSLLYERYIAYIPIFYVLRTLIKVLLVPVRSECEIHEQNIGIRLEPVLALNTLDGASMAK
jgi:hypothetical protein